MKKRILVGIDFSEPAEQAAKHALRLARQAGAELVLAYAELPISYELGVPTEVIGPFRDGLADAARGRHTQLAEIGERLSGQGVAVSQVLMEGSPEEVLCSLADRMDVDLVVVGSRGRTGFARLLLGSVATAVVRQCSRSVFVARGRSTDGGYHRILIPVDFSEAAEDQIDAALRLAAPGAELVVMHCWHVPYSAYSMYAEAGLLGVSLASDLRNFADKRGAELLERHRPSGVKLRYRAVEAPAAVGIQQVLDENNFDLVVTGSNNRRGVKRWLLGSVAEATVRHAGCSVLVVRA